MSSRYLVPKGVRRDEGASKCPNKRKKTEGEEIIVNFLSVFAVVPDGKGDEGKEGQGKTKPHRGNLTVDSNRTSASSLDPTGTEFGSCAKSSRPQRSKDDKTRTRNVEENEEYETS